MPIANNYLLSRTKTLRFLDELETANVVIETTYIPPGMAPSTLETKTLPPVGFLPLPEELNGQAITSPTGSVFFRGVSQGWLVLPPFPLSAEKYQVTGFTVERLRSTLQRDFKIALVLIRLGSYAVGVCQGENLLHSKVGTGLVHSRHRQGGSSAHRFERHRDKQIESFLTRVCEHVRQHLEPEARAIDYTVYGGARTTILLLKKECPFLAQFDDRTLPPLLDIPDPRQPVLETAIGRAWSSRVIEWNWDTNR